MVIQMTTYRNNLPQFDGTILLTDSGLETTLIFHDGIDLPAFAAYPLMETDSGRETLARYYRRHLSIAADHGTGFVLEAPTWRASRDWGAELGHSPRTSRDSTRRRSVSCRTCARRRPSCLCGNQNFTARSC